MDAFGTRFGPPPNILVKELQRKTCDRDSNGNIVKMKGTAARYTLTQKRMKRSCKRDVSGKLI
ncbi:unnamed protein product [Caenorhabditis auriculariae]|uniref:Uncharacterized protein n=1 Tax=Caenorhabditis auriculariae TaxID=2777116 RepID=A0A8S1GVL5_9PELO|nr:unnamed protein product [Caenorhabditis auriculariae]